MNKGAQRFQLSIDIPGRRLMLKPQGLSISLPPCKKQIIRRQACKGGEERSALKTGVCSLPCRWSQQPF